MGSALVFRFMQGILILLHGVSVKARIPDSRQSCAPFKHNMITDVDDIPLGLKSRFTSLKEPAIARYKSYLMDKSMSSHSEEFCEDGGLVCDSNVDLELFGGRNRQYQRYRCDITINLDSIAKPIGYLREKQLQKGAKIALQDIRNPTLKRSFLPSALSSQFPFSSGRLSELLSILNIKNSSVMAERMASTLHECESKIDDGDEIKFCAASAEELFRLASEQILGGCDNNNRKFGILETSSSQGSHETVELMDVHLRASTNQKVIACHDSPFPYTVFYCHQISNTKVYETSWVASKGNTVRAVGVCHMDTSHFDGSHPAFAELHIKPGEAEVCHWMSESNPVWFSK